MKRNVTKEVNGLKNEELTAWTEQNEFKQNTKGIYKWCHPKRGAASWTEERTQPFSKRSGDSSKLGRPHSGMTLAHTWYFSLVMY